MRIIGFITIINFSFFLFSCQPTNDKTVVNPVSAFRAPDEIFGSLFHDVQMNSVFPDGKTFADCTPKYPADTILSRYESSKGKPGFDLRQFVLEHFEPPVPLNSGFQSDLSRTPAAHIEALWDVLTRRPDKADGVGSLIPLPNPYIVPGGRFGEVYYWDSYFTMLGLQSSGRNDMIRSMVDNFAWLIDTIGFIPNGNRTYYLGRSQPPFFSLTVKLVEETSGLDTALRYLPQLEREYAFWMEGPRAVRMPDGSVLNRYFDNRPKPRPESYREDMETSQNSPRESAAVWQDLRAAAESGWDFSSRWFDDPMNLSTIRTTAIIPVDLNALLFHLEQTIAEYAEKAGKSEQAARFKTLAAERQKALLQYCWSAKQGFFVDYDHERAQQTGKLTLAGMFPLYFGLANAEQAAACAQVLEREFLKPGGLITTTVKTGQQWDAPNGWAPLQWISIQGLREYGHRDLAQEVRSRWIALNERVYKNTGKMLEKYNVMDMTLEAGGGEYPVQDGFGWSNGVLLRLLSEE